MVTTASVSSSIDRHAGFIYNRAPFLDVVFQVLAEMGGGIAYRRSPLTFERFGNVWSLDRTLHSL